MTMRTLSFSLVVATVGRIAELDALLSSLLRQTLLPMEVIVVDQNLDDRLSEVLAPYVDGLNVKHIKAESKGVSRARNIGQRVAVGDVITFPDDDCIYPESLLESVAHMFCSRQNLDAISVRSTSSEGDLGVTRFWKDSRPVTRFNVFRTVVEFGLFFRRSALAEIEFNETLGVGALTPYWSDEGADLAVRFIASGKQILYVPELVIFHENPVRDYDEKARLRSARYGCGRGRFLRLHRYPWWFVAYTWGTYLAGSMVSLAQLNVKKSRYYWAGFKSRVRCYHDKL